MNSMQLKDKLRNISNKQNLEFNIVLRNYMYERFVERLANSNYRSNFIFKGGYLLSTIFGLNNRHTIDIDLSLKNKVLSKDNIYKIITDIIKIDVDDIAIITLDSISNIREEDEYGGYRVKLTIRIENVVESFNIDIATGDPITPKEVIFKYQTMFDYKFINLKSYNFETILAEKIETILSKLEFNSRIKDFYDIYLIYTLASDKIDKEVLYQAVKNTFQKRNFKGDVSYLIKFINESNILRNRWKAFSKHNKYAENIEFDVVIECLNKILGDINMVKL